jgi:hypothetical protein
VANKKAARHAGDIARRVIERRAFEVVVWGMPVVNDISRRHPCRSRASRRPRAAFARSQISEMQKNDDGSIDVLPNVVGQANR